MRTADEVLDLLRRGMASIARQQREAIEAGEDPAWVAREGSQHALNGVMAAFQSADIETAPLMALLSALSAVAAGSSLPEMLAPAATPHRRPDAPEIEGKKGRLAALMEYRQSQGLTRKVAADWVARHIPKELARSLGSISRRSVDDWREKWGGDRGAVPGAGRDGYLAMRTILLDHSPTESGLITILSALAKSPLG